jgi:signal peptidase I
MAIQHLAILAILASTAHADIILSTTRGRSNEPWIHDGEVVRIDTSVPFSALRHGDIVSFKDPTSPSGRTVHELVYRKGNAWWPKGFANRFMDRIYVTQDNYLGRVIPPRARPKDRVWFRD